MIFKPKHEILQQAVHVLLPLEVALLPPPAVVLHHPYSIKKRNVRPQYDTLKK